MDALLLSLHVLFCLGIMFSSFCRLHHCTADVKLEVRISIAAVGAACAAMMMGPFIGWLAIAPVIVVMEGCTMAYFIAGSQAWKYGIPPGLSKPIFERRSGKDRRAS